MIDLKKTEYHTPWMILLLALAFLMTAAGVCAGQKGAALEVGGQSQPAAEIPELEYDAGLVQGNEVVTHDFLIENKGTADLVIKKVAPT